jgi:hypothetical protein
MLAAQAETVIKCPGRGRQAYSDLPNFEEKAEEDLSYLDFGRYQRMTIVDSSVLEPSYVGVKFGSQANQKPQKTNSFFCCDYTMVCTASNAKCNAKYHAGAPSSLVYFGRYHFITASPQ